ncbi:AAA family ATPase [Rhizobium sp. NZLR3b]|uniref:ATP-binding protein n=1 Tax=Rhizobium sp. NZLR3b TaxID=2731101 RepID=UPI001C83CEF0|nr:ATP-binding protein [Rhizobium sp. NZLR3b]MBX5192633.1 AAA family ATPase [Rhizobium sp. NZLR3b]
MTDTTASSRPLHLQTIDSLFADLIGGASVSSGTEGELFRLDELDSRKILNWYRLNKSKWAGNVKATDVDAIALSLQSPVPSLPAVEPFTSGSSRRLKISKVVAHRFAGLHSYGTAGAAPPDFVFEPKEAITLFEGWNGAGKTSLLNSIIWCLTGELLRPQRPPEKGEEEFEGFYTRTVDGEDQMAGHTLTPITPLPNPAYYIPPIGRDVPIDSWVEIIFVDQNGNPLSPVRRTQVRNAKGKVTETVSGLDELAIDPISLRIGTVMPALLQFLRVGSASDMGKAPARLTGLADISDLAKHAGKARDKLRGELKKEREREIDDIDSRFLQARSDLQKQIDEYPMMAPKVPVPPPSASRDLEEQLTALTSHFSALKADAFRDAQQIFGPAFDPSDKAARDELEENIGPAQGQLRSMGQLANVQRSRLLGELKDEDWSAVDKLVSKLRAEAVALAELAKTPRLGVRKQLYARVADWISDQAEHDPESCGICSRSLVGVMDPVTSRSVLDHLAEVSEAEQKLLSLTHQNWASSWNNQLVAKVPSTLQAELARDLPGHPSDLIRVLSQIFSKVAEPADAGHTYAASEANC